MYFLPCDVGVEYHHCLYPCMSEKRLKGGLGHQLMLLFCVGIVHTDLYNWIS